MQDCCQFCYVLEVWFMYIVLMVLLIVLYYFQKYFDLKNKLQSYINNERKENWMR